jgi:lysophospholipid acyltransferase (LPLAT)-like uncharacterized protein
MTFFRICCKKSSSYENILHQMLVFIFVAWHSSIIASPNTFLNFRNHRENSIAPKTDTKTAHNCAAFCRGEQFTHEHATQYSAFHPFH